MGKNKRASRGCVRPRKAGKGNIRYKKVAQKVQHINHLTEPKFQNLDPEIWNLVINHLKEPSKRDLCNLRQVTKNLGVCGTLLYETFTKPRIPDRYLVHLNDLETIGEKMAKYKELYNKDKDLIDGMRLDFCRYCGTRQQYCRCDFDYFAYKNNAKHCEGCGTMRYVQDVLAHSICEDCYNNPPKKMKIKYQSYDDWSDDEDEYSRYWM